MSASIAELPERLRQRIVVDEESGCWRWTAGRAGKGYPYFWWQGRMAYVHRIVFHLLADPTLPIHHGGHDECLDHVHERCTHRPDCVNPAHLDRVPWAENLRRFHRANPGHNKKGWETRRAQQVAS